VRQQRGRIEQLAEAAHRDDAGLIEERLLDERGGGRGGGVRAGGALPRGGQAGRHGEDRHLPAHPAGGPGELARVAEGLDVQHRKLGGLVGGPPHEHVVAAHVQLVADGGERRHADAQPGQMLGYGDADPAGLHHDAGAAGRRMPGEERGVEMDVALGVGDAEAVRPDQAHPEPAAGRQ
jgi:hypothetical protein